MSTRWNNALKLQKTPKVCKKVPPPPPTAETQFKTFPLQAYAAWDDPHTPLEQKISGTCSLTPHPTAYIHQGIIAGDRAHLELSLQWNRFALEFTYTISLYIDQIFQKSVFVVFTQPSPQLPFAAGLFTWKASPTSEHVESKIFS